MVFVTPTVLRYRVGIKFSFLRSSFLGGLSGRGFSCEGKFPGLGEKHVLLCPGRFVVGVEPSISWPSIDVLHVTRKFFSDSEKESRFLLRICQQRRGTKIRRDTHTYVYAIPTVYM